MPADQSLPALRQTATRLPPSSEAGGQPGRPTGPGCPSGRGGSSGLGDAEHLPPVVGWTQRLVPAAPGSAQCQVTAQPASSHHASLCCNLNLLPQPKGKASPNGLSQMFPFNFIPSAEASVKDEVERRPPRTGSRGLSFKNVFFVVRMMPVVGFSPYPTAEFTGSRWGVVPLVRGSGHVKSQGPRKGKPLGWILKGISVKLCHVTSFKSCLRCVCSI